MSEARELYHMPTRGNEDARRGMISHFFTVDVEEHFQVSAFESVVDRRDWDRHESRVGANVGRLLALLDEYGARGTFFVLGWVAERHPAVVKAIAHGGHEVASHGWDHRRVTTQTPDEFRESVRRAKAVLEDLGGAAVIGFRAPSFSLVTGREWALDILVEEGYRYDSSLFPVRRPGYGYAAGGREPYVIQRSGGTLMEFPPATLRRWRWNIPAAGGAYLRLFPLGLVRSAVRDFDRRGVPATVYVHPWELDPEQPRLPVPRLTRWRHYTGLAKVHARLRVLLGEFRFTAMRDGLGTVEMRAPA